MTDNEKFLFIRLLFYFIIVPYMMYGTNEIASNKHFLLSSIKTSSDFPEYSINAHQEKFLKQEEKNQLFQKFPCDDTLVSSCAYAPKMFWISSNVLQEVVLESFISTNEWSHRINSGTLFILWWSSYSLAQRCLVYCFGFLLNDIPCIFIVFLKALPISNTFL